MPARVMSCVASVAIWPPYGVSGTRAASWRCQLNQRSASRRKRSYASSAAGLMNGRARMFFVPYSNNRPGNFTTTRRLSAALPVVAFPLTRIVERVLPVLTRTRAVGHCWPRRPRTRSILAVASTLELRRDLRKLAIELHRRGPLRTPERPASEQHFGLSPPALVKHACERHDRLGRASSTVPLIVGSANHGRLDVRDELPQPGLRRLIRSARVEGVDVNPQQVALLELANDDHTRNTSRASSTVMNSSLSGRSASCPHSMGMPVRPARSASAVFSAAFAAGIVLAGIYATQTFMLWFMMNRVDDGNAGDRAAHPRSAHRERAVLLSKTMSTDRQSAPSQDGSSPTSAQRC